MLSCEARSVGDAWVAMTRLCLANGQRVLDEDVPIRELEGVTFSITEPKTDDPIIERYGDKSMIKSMKNNFIESEPQFGYAFGYGERIWQGDPSPLDTVIALLSRKPESKSATLPLLLSGDRASSHLPCIALLDFKIRRGTLNLHYFSRSQDLYKKSYADNIALLNILEHMAQTLAVSPGRVSGYIASGHIYEADYASMARCALFSDLCCREAAE